MHPIQRTWSRTRVNLMQRCPRAFVLRYGIAAYAASHPTGQLLKDSFAIQTPWILMQMSIRDTIRDYVEDYQMGMEWSRNLVQLKFNQAFRYRIEDRNSIIVQLKEWKEPDSIFRRVKPEKHLEEIGAERCAKLIGNESFKHILDTMDLKSIPATRSKLVDGIKVYNSSDFCAKKGADSFLIRINLFGYSSDDEINQNAALFSLGTENQTIMQYSWKNGKWFIHKTNVSTKENKSIRRLILLDSQEMERILKLVGSKNNLEQVPFADSSRTCMHCSIRFLCPAKNRLEEAKGEQMALMC
jgi:hypothetical protein